MFRLLVLSTLLVAAFGAPNLKKPRFDGRIVGGEPTTIEEYPHQVSLRSYNSHICGGSVLNQKFVVTAAHCTDGASARSLSILAGVTNRNQLGSQVINVKAIHQNPNYDPYDINQDISILELETELVLSDKIKPVKLPKQEPDEGTKVTVTGWGTTSSGGSSLPTILQRVQVAIVSREDCKIAYRGYTITSYMICAQAEGKDSCQGDSGGPLVDNDGTLVGVVSWGIGCANRNYPGVYSNVAALRGYINEVTEL